MSKKKVKSRSDGNEERCGDVSTGMSSLTDIKTEIDRLTERRAELFHQLSEEHEPELAAEHQQIEEQLADLWEEQRIERARLRFGEREEIIHRARAEERLERAA
jgi:hypothetical protein